MSDIQSSFGRHKKGGVVKEREKTNLRDYNGDVSIESITNGLLQQRRLCKSAHQEQIINTVSKILVTQHVLNMLQIDT